MFELNLTENRQMSNAHTNLHITGFSGTLHSAGDIHRVAPDVVVWFLSTDYSGYNRTLADS